MEYLAYYEFLFIIQHFMTKYLTNLIIIYYYTYYEYFR